MPEDRTKIADISAPYFEHCARGVLAAPRCQGCREFFFYPTVLCPRCHSFDWEWEPTGGRGTVYSFTVVHRSLGPRLPAPYIVASVELEEGIRLMTNLKNVDPADVAIGLPVRATFGESWDGRSVAFFEPAA